MVTSASRTRACHAGTSGSRSTIRFLGRMNPQGQRWGARISATFTGICIAAALVFAPLAFGASEPWAFSLLAVLGYTALGAAVARAVLEGDARAFAAPILVPMALGLCLVLVQRARWPSGVMALVTPRTVVAYADASASMGGNLPESLPASLYPHGTSLALVRLSSYIALFAATFSYVRGLKEITFLGVAILSVGFFAAVVGILQSTSGADRIYWLRRPPHGGFFGPFAGRNQYAAYAALCTFVGVGLLLSGASRWIGTGGTWAELLVQNGPQVVLLVFAIGVIGASVLWSLSRAGTVSMLLGFAGVFAATGLTQHRVRCWILTASGLVVVLAVVTCLGWGPVLRRLWTLEDIARDPTATWRWMMFGDALRIGCAFPMLGVGAGAFSSVYPAYRTIPTAALAESPHNEYLHVFAEAGVPGLLLVFCALLILFIAVFRGLCTRRHFYLPGFLAGGAGAMVSVTLHSLVDYPMRSPAIAATAAVVAAMLCRAAVLESRHGRESGYQGEGGRRQRTTASAAGPASGRESAMPPALLGHSVPVLGRSAGWAAAAKFLGVAVVVALCAQTVHWGLSPLRGQLEERGLRRFAATSERTPQQALVRVSGAAARIRRNWSDDAGLQAQLGDVAAREAMTATDPLLKLRFADRALALHGAAACLEPLNATHPVSLVSDCLAAARPDLAWGYAERARELVPGDPSLRAHLAAMFARSGYPTAAKGYLAEAERLAESRQITEASALIRSVRAQLAAPKD